MFKKIFGFIDLIVSIIAGILLIIGAYGGYVNPEIWVIPSIMVLMFPAILIFCLILLIVNIISFRKIALINIIFLAICWKAIIYFCPLNFNNPDFSLDGFRMATYNVFNLKDFEASDSITDTENPTLDYILSVSPDFIAMQECLTLEHAGDGAAISKTLKNKILKTYPYRDISDWGQSLFSKYPFRVLPQPHPHEYSFQVRCYEIYIKTDTISLVNIHLQSIGLTSDDKELYMQLTEGHSEKQGLKKEISEIRHDLLDKLNIAFRKRAEQIEKICEITAGLKSPVIVCGDFNDVTLSYACRRLMESGFTDAYRKAGIGPVITYHDNRFYFRIDHVFYKGAIVPSYAGVGKNPSSDHYPLFVDFNFTRHNLPD